MSTPAAELTDVTLRFSGNRPDDPEVTALDNSSLQVSPGEFLAVVQRWLLHWRAAGRATSVVSR